MTMHPATAVDMEINELKWNLIGTFMHRGNIGSFPC